MLPIVGAVLEIINKFVPDKAKRDELALELVKVENQKYLETLQNDTKLALGQLEVNKEEAKSEDWFVRRWRPFVGWVCGGCFAWNTVGIGLTNALLSLVVATGGMTQAELSAIQLHPVDGELVYSMLLAILGLGGMRTFEKKVGVAR